MRGLRAKSAPLVASALLLAGAARATVRREPVNARLTLAPGQAETITIETREPVEVGWEAVQLRKCETDCVRATDKSAKNATGFSSGLGAMMKYAPVSGKIVVEFANTGDIPVTLNVYEIVRVCDAESCALFKGEPKTRWLVFKIDEFKSIATSADASYSTISGVTTAGKPFTVKAVWWTDDPASSFACAKSIKGYLDGATPKEKYAPYILSGAAIEGKDLILENVDTCVPKAPDFGAPEGNVFK
jgi:hypothetical protein